MNKFDRYIQEQLSEDETELPDSVRRKIDETLFELPEKTTCKRPVYVYRHVAVAAACFAFVFLFLLPNVSVVYAHALEQIPVIGQIVRVVTIRNYFYSDDYHEMDIKVPKVENENSEAFDFINASAEELTESLVEKFYNDMEVLGEDAHGSLYADYEVITNTEKWFTLKLRVHEAIGSGNTYYKYYHLNKLTGKTVRLGDMIADDEFYSFVEQAIKVQMDERMQKDSNLKYWIHNDSFGEEFVDITPEHNFYWNADGNLVIPFDKYEVAPGYMGTPEFVIDKDSIKDMLKDEMR